MLFQQRADDPQMLGEGGGESTAERCLPGEGGRLFAKADTRALVQQQESEPVLGELQVLRTPLLAEPVTVLRQVSCLRRERRVALT